MLPFSQKFSSWFVWSVVFKNCLHFIDQGLKEIFRCISWSLSCCWSCLFNSHLFASISIVNETS